MEDSFFGFDTSVPLDDDGGGQIAEPSEEEYDALNDETFGSAINGDWEEVHENLVRLTGDAEGDGDTLDNGKHVRNAGYSSLSELNRSRSRHFADSDLEINLSGMKLDDVDLNYGDNENISGLFGDTVKMDPSVWSLHSRDRSVNETSNNSAIRGSLSSNPEEFLREHFPTPFQHHRQQNQHACNQHQTSNVDLGLSQLSQKPLHVSLQQEQPKICTLEDIERNMRIQQSISKQPQVHQQEVSQQQTEADLITKQQKIMHDILRHSSETPTLLQQSQHYLQHGTQQQQQQHQHMLSQQYSNLLAQKVPQVSRGFVNPNQQLQQRPSNNFTNNLAQQPLGNILQQQPPGFYFQQPGYHQIPPHILLNQHGGVPNNFSNQRSLPNAHLPVALNNFAMHPNFNAMRATARGMHPAAILAQQQQGTPPRIPGHPNPMMLLNQNPNSSNSSFNMFNMRLVQEIQQNHPLLQNTARHTQQHQQQNAIDRSHNNNSQRIGCVPNVTCGGSAVGNQKQSHNMRRDIISANGNLPHDEFDEYANLMSTREKHWLIGIQLSQLNTDTPYIDDYYYTVFKERKSATSGNVRHSQAHKDNQLNHPLTQPKGHAQLILVQLGNKNGQRNGQHRERRNSENHNQNQDVKVPTYVFTPLKFENSLGKLQYGSVTAPRKIIDAEIMTNETSAITNVTKVAGKDTLVQLGSTAGTPSNISVGIKSETPALLQMSNTTGELTAANSQRKSRYILLHIETLYRILLKLEDLNNPNVIATILMKKKKESERIAALEQLENANKTSEERAEDSSNNPTMKSKFNYEIETKDDLIEKLVVGLHHDKVIAMMNVRKGKKIERTSKQQKLVDYMSYNLEFARDQFDKLNANCNFKKQWEALKVYLNSLGGSEKCVEQWKKTSNLALNTRRKFMNRTVCDSWADVPRDLNPLEKIITVDTVDGYSCTPESGIIRLVEESLEVLIRRIMSNIEHHDIRWNVWMGVFSSLQNVIKKDRDDAEGVLYSLYPDFIKQIKSANFEIIVKISLAITLNDKKSNGVFCSKFGISSLVCLILQAENIYEANDDDTLTDNNKDSWRQFLDQVASSLNRTIQKQTICAAIESDSIQPIMNHFARFKDLKLDSLLALITEAKQQIN